MKKPSPYAEFETSKDRESGNGVKIQFDGYSITIHRAGGSNKKYGVVLAEKMKPYMDRFNRGDLDDATSEQILIEAFAEGIIVDWENVHDKAGKLIPFTPKNVAKVLTDLPEILSRLRAKANDFATFRERQEKADEKN